MKTLVGVEGFEAMAARKLERAGRLSRGETVQAERRVMFATAEEMRARTTGAEGEDAGRRAEL